MSAFLTFIIGCTGCGKARLGHCLARRLGAEIVSIDSMKVYREMDIGTAKPGAARRAEVPYHLVDVVDPSKEFSVAEYVSTADREIADIHGRGKPVLVVGGTPLYIKALVAGLFDGPSADADLRTELNDEVERVGLATMHARLAEIDPATARRIHSNDQRRIVRALEVHALTGRPISELQTQWDAGRARYEHRFIGLRRSLEDQNRRTNERVARMVEEGLVDEVQRLLDRPMPLSSTARKALGYAEIISHLQGEVSLAEAVELIKIHTRRLAKAQRTWFKRFAEVEWVDLCPDDDADAIADRLLSVRGGRWSH